MLSTRSFDAVVVGAGPAGSATAALLAERGYKVALVERATFPRPKPCAEYLSPEASRVLDRLLPQRALDDEYPARLDGMRIVSPDGTCFTGRFLGSHGYHGYASHGIALPREVLDHHLALAAVSRGVTLLEDTTVLGFQGNETGPRPRPHSRPRRLAIRCRGRQSTIAGRIVIGADGLHSRVARLLGVARRGALRRIALVSHATDVRSMEALGEMHVSSEGYLGLAPIGRGITNLAVVADLGRVAPKRPIEQWFHALVSGYPAVRERLESARFVSPVRVVGPFARWTRRATGHRVLLVGDAADFYDPFTGEGIYAALTGAELAAKHAGQALEHDRVSARELAPYDGARRRAFGGKWIVERLISCVIARPALLNHIARRLSAKPHLADLLVGVTGNFVPTSRVLSPTYLWQLVR